jgi:hypothetical protein
MENELGKLMVLGAAILGVLYVFGKAPKIGASQNKRMPRRPSAKGSVWARGPVSADFADDGLAFPAAPIM